MAALLALAASSCGSAAAPDASADPSTAPSGTPSGAPATRMGGCPVGATPSATFTDLTGDMPEHYAENHAFQRRMDLCGEVLDRARSEQRRTSRALEAVRADGAVSVAAVRDALVHLGYPATAMGVTEAPGAVSFWVELNPFCIEGDVGSAAVDVEYAGVYYSEGIGCVRPEGGH